MLVKLAQAIYHGCRCLLGVHEFVQDSVQAKYDICRHCGLRTRAV